MPKLFKWRIGFSIHYYSGCKVNHYARVDFDDFPGSN